MFKVQLAITEGADINDRKYFLVGLRKKFDIHHWPEQTNAGIGCKKIAVLLAGQAEIIDINIAIIEV